MSRVLVCISQMRKFHDFWFPYPSELILSVVWLVLLAIGTAVPSFCCWFGHWLFLLWECSSPDTLVAHPFSSISPAPKLHLTDACCDTSIAVLAFPHPQLSCYSSLCFTLSFPLYFSPLNKLYTHTICYIYWLLSGRDFCPLTSEKLVPGVLNKYLVSNKLIRTGRVWKIFLEWVAERWGSHSLWTTMGSREEPGDRKSVV